MKEILAASGTELPESITPPRRSMRMKKRTFSRSSPDEHTLVLLANDSLVNPEQVADHVFFVANAWIK
jgi:hypothetical protein